jgi:hypothetical protein
MTIIPNDFKITNEWIPDYEGTTWGFQDENGLQFEPASYILQQNIPSEYMCMGNPEPEYIIDKSTGRKYWNEETSSIRFKCFLLCIGTPVVHFVASIVNVAAQVVNIAKSFFTPKKEQANLDEKSNFLPKNKLNISVVDKAIFKITRQPFALITLELSAIYGIFKPLDGRKLYASIERAQYERHVLAPCFQPDPTQHLFGGDPKKKGAF